MAKRKSAYRDYPPLYGSYPPYGYSPYTKATRDAWKAYGSPMTQNYTILANDSVSGQWRLITHYANGTDRQDAVNSYYRNGKNVPSVLLVFPTERERS
jgi:hypothetical protein